MTQMIGPAFLGPSDVAGAPEPLRWSGRTKAPTGWSSLCLVESEAGQVTGECKAKVHFSYSPSFPLVLLELGSFTFGFDRLCEALPRAPTEGSSDGGTLTFGVVQNLALDP
jgi:hypothetical protein